MVEGLCYKPDSTPDGEVFDYFSAPNSFSRTMALGFTQPVTEVSIERFLRVKRGRRVRLAT
jgi:hypothetical protein